jgi:4-amino-4-deoxy-L-arabinose transferase-like glycosyltransferase
MEKTTIYATIIILFFLAISLYNISDYGMAWDEEFQQHIGEENLKYITGETEELNLELDFIYYGPFYEILNILTVKFLLLYTNIDSIPAHHVLNILFATLGLILLFFFIQKAINKETAVLTILLLALSPLFIAHAQYNTKDIPILVFSIIIFFFYYKTCTERKYSFAIYTGIATAAALTTKITAIIIPAIIALSYLLTTLYEKRYKEKNLLKQDTKLCTAYLLTTIVCTYIFWPALWKNPLLFFQAIQYFFQHQWPGSVFYFGQLYPAGQAPWHYALIYLFLETPLLIVGAALLGIYSSTKKILQKEKILFYTLLLCWLLLPLALESKPGTVIYNGIRHFLLVLPALCILAAIGIEKIIQKIKQKSFPKKTFLLTVFFLVLLLLPQSIELHPYESLYMNEAIQIIYPEHLEEKFDMDYWALSYKEGIEWLNNNASEGAEVCVPFAEDIPLFYDYRSDLSFACHEQTMDYVMFLTRNKDYLLDYPIIFNVTRYDSYLLYIYEVQT